MRARTVQGGMTTVEFAIVGAVVITVLFAVIELGRIIFTFNLLQEGARRAARVAAVCAIGDSEIAEKAKLPGLHEMNVDVNYLPLAGVPNKLVRVRVSGYTMSLVIPFINLEFEAPEFSSTLPAESLGIPGDKGGIPAC